MDTNDSIDDGSCMYTGFVSSFVYSEDFIFLLCCCCVAHFYRLQSIVFIPIVLFLLRNVPPSFLSCVPSWTITEELLFGESRLRHRPAYRSCSVWLACGGRSRTRLAIYIARLLPAACLRLFPCSSHLIVWFNGLSYECRR